MSAPGEGETPVIVELGAAQFAVDLANLKKAVAHAEEKASRAEERSGTAAGVALAAVESVKHFQNALEASHAQVAELLSAQRKMVNVVEMLARSVLGK